MLNILVAGNWEKDGVADHVVEPFRYYKHKLATQCEAVVEMRPANSLAELSSVLKSSSADIAFLTTCWRNPVDETIAFFKEVHGWKNRPRIIYLDYFDQSSSPFFGILPYVDGYVKKQLYKDLANYRKDYIGGYMVTDFISRHYNIPANDWHFGSYLPEEQEHKLIPGWNVATHKEIRRSLVYSKWRHLALFTRRKDIDIHCRVSLGDEKESWYYHRHRIESLKALEPLRAEYKIISSLNDDKWMGARAFNREMARSRIGLSPFGYGEVTYRDYSCIVYGALLIKPDMSHIITYPDIFHAGETYVPVKWDLSDVEEKCRYYLEHPQEARKIIRNARNAFEDYFKDQKDYHQIRHILAKVLPGFLADDSHNMTDEDNPLKA